MKKRIIIVILAVLAMLVGSAATAEARPRSAVGELVVTLDVSSTNLIVGSDVASMWSKGTDVTVAVGTCASGTPFCAKVEVVDWPGGPEACGISCPAGYNYGDAHTGCTIQVGTTAATYSDTDLQFNVLGHETGHCLGLQHNPDSRSIMYASISKDDNRKRPTAYDKNVLNTLW